MILSKPEVHFDAFREDASLRDPIHSDAKWRVKIGSDVRNGNGHPFIDGNQSSALAKVKAQGTGDNEDGQGGSYIYSEPPLLGRGIFHL